MYLSLFNLGETVTGGVFDLTRTFNGYGEIEGENFIVNSQSPDSWNLVRDKTGRITAKTETIGGITSNYAYTYDSIGRLLTVTKEGTLIEEYQYDSVGRRTYEMSALKGITGRTFTYSDEDHLLTAGNTTYQYDLDGFLNTKTQGTNVTYYNYSSRGELLSANLPGGTVIEYINDPLGRRVAKKVNGVVVEKYLWRGLSQLLAVYNGSDNLIMRFEYADDRMPVAMTKGGTTYYLTYDQVGSLRAVADASGNVIKRIDYDSFGSISNDTNPGFVVPFGFAGGLYDRDTGLVKFGFRDYDPNAGRWIAKDPILFAGGDVDLYGYVNNNPANWIDPLGLDSLRYHVNALFPYVEWLNDNGFPIEYYPAYSGTPTGRYKPLPYGLYAGTNLRRRTTPAGMTCHGRQGWSLDLNPSNFCTDRTLLRIHPHTIPVRTQGCIGISCAFSENLYNRLRDYFNSGHSDIPVEVTY